MWAVCAAWCLNCGFFYLLCRTPCPPICHNWSERCEGCLICHWTAVFWSTEPDSSKFSCGIVRGILKLYEQYETGYCLRNLRNPQFMVHKTNVVVYYWSKMLPLQRLQYFKRLSEFLPLEVTVQSVLVNVTFNISSVGLYIHRTSFSQTLMLLMLSIWGEKYIHA